MIQDVDFTKKDKKKKEKNLLGKKPKKDFEFIEDGKVNDEALSKSIGKLKVEETPGNSESEYETVSDEEMYESDDNSEYYEEKHISEHIKGKKNDDDVINIWDEKNKGKSKDEELVFDNSAYLMLHRLSVEWPIFSVDWIVPEYFEKQPLKNFYGKISKFRHPDDFPYTGYFIGGAQTSNPNGCLYLMKWFNMHKTVHDDDPDKEADTESEGAEPRMECMEIKSKGNINRVKSMQNSYIASYWSDSGSVELIDIRNNIEDLESRTKDIDEDDYNQSKKKKKKIEEKNPHVKSFKKKSEGFALDWNNIVPGMFASGGFTGDLDIYIPKDEICSDYITTNASNSFNFNNVIKKSHKDGIEDIMWSPTEQHIIGSCGNDSSICIWDLRISSQQSCVIRVENAHKGDINCISWKNSVGVDIICSGGDDGVIKVWDPKYISNSESTIAKIEYHKGPITALSWDPISPCQLSATSEDNRLTIWDLSVEADEKKYKDINNNDYIPDQLVFLHQGQENLKDVKFHPYYKEMLISTAENGLNMFRPNFDDLDSEDEEFDDFTFNK